MSSSAGPSFMGGLLKAFVPASQSQGEVRVTEGTELGQINEGLMELYDEQPEECVGFSIIVKHRRIEGLWLRAVITGYNNALDQIDHSFGCPDDTAGTLRFQHHALASRAVRGDALPLRVDP